MERFIDIKGFEGYYQVSNLGRIKSLIFYRGTNERIRPPARNGIYSIITLYKNGNKKSFQVHRLVAQAFLGLNIENEKIYVCHKSEELDKNGLLKNNLENLFLGNPLVNMRDMVKKGRSLKGKYNKNSSKKIIQKTKKGEKIKEWNSISDAYRELGIDISCIAKVCRGERNYAGGYIWNFI